MEMRKLYDQSGGDLAAVERELLARGVETAIEEDRKSLLSQIGSRRAMTIIGVRKNT